MRRSLLVFALLICGLQPVSARLRAPSCDAAIAFALTQLDAIEMSFGKRVDDMTADDFSQAIDIVSVCMDAVAAAPPDVPGLLPRERKRTQVNALTALAEDLVFFRNRQRERERRAAK